MKLNIFCIAAIMGLAAAPALAQDPHSSDTTIVADTIAIDAPAMTVETDTVTIDEGNMQGDYTHSDEIDSLRQVVSEMKSQMEATSAAQDELTQENEQRRIWQDRAKYFNIYYVNQSLTQKDIDGTWRNDFGVALAMGKTFYLHKKPILGMIKFGIDWTYFDLNYSKYTDEWGFFNGSYEDNYHDNYWYDYEGMESEDVHQAEIGMGIGLSVTVNPYDELKIAGHFRVIPTYSMLYAAEDFSSSYGTFFSLGASIAWKAISLGVEARWGTAKYDSVFNLDDIEDIDYDNVDDTDFDILSGNYDGSSKWKTSSVRFYISFRY